MTDPTLLYAPHGEPGNFFCPWQPFRNSPLDLLRWKLRGKAPYDRKTPPRPQHMDPREALQAFRDLGARSLLAMHWGTFDLTDEPVDLAPRVLDQILAAEGSGEEKARVRHLAVGERWLVP